MANNWQIDMIAGLDTNQSRAKINSQINKLKGQLKDISLTAKIDPKIASDIQKQLTNLQVSLTNVKISDKALNDMVSQINNALQGIKIPNINIGGNGSQQFVNNITNGFKQSTNAIEAFKNSLSNAGKSSSEIDNIVKKVQALNVQIDSLRFSESTNGSMNVNVAGLDEFGNKVKITQTLLQDLQTMQWNVSNTTTSVVSTKELERINNVFTDYTAKLAQFKSTNTNILSGLTQPLADFESKLAGLKNGTVSIDEVKNAFKLLGTEASKITENFTGQLSKTDAAIRKLAQGDEIMDKLKASFKGLNNAPKEITKELNSVSKLLQNVKNIESTEGRTANWSAEYRKWSDEVDKLQAKLSVLQKQQANMTTPQIFKTSELRNADIPYMTKVSNTIEKQMVEIQKMANAKGWQKFEVKGVEETDGKIKALTLTIRDAEGALKQFTMQRAKLQGSGKAQTGLMQVGDVKVLETASQAQEKLAQSTEKANAKLAEQANKIQLSSDVTKLTTDYQKFGVVSQEVENNLKELKLAQEAVINAKGTDRLATEIQRYDTALDKAKSSLKELTTTQVSMNQRTSQMTSMQEWMRKNKNATKLVGDQVNKLIEECKTCDAVRFNGIKNEFKDLQVQAGKAGKLGNSLFGGIIEQGKKFVQWIGVTGTVMRGIQISRDMIQNVKDLDDSLLELVKVSDLSASGLEKVTEQAYELGEKVGRTGRQVIDAVTEFKRAGYEMQDSLNMAEAALVMTNVAEGINDTADAAGTLISVLKGYNMSESDAMSIVDMMNSTSNQSPIGFDELAEGLERTAGTMAQSGTTIQETIGLITAGYAQLRNVEKVSTSLITLSARLRGVNEDGEEIDGLSAELQESFGKIGVAIEDADGNLRSIYAIAKDYAKVLPTLTSEQKQYYAELAAGKRNVTTWNAITQQFQDAENATAQAIDSVGSASEENSKYLNSISGKVSQFNSAVEQLSSTVVDSDLVKFFVDLGTTGVKAIDGLVNALTPLGTIGLGAGLLAGFKNVGINTLVAY